MSSLDCSDSSGAEPSPNTTETKLKRRRYSEIKPGANKKARKLQKYKSEHYEPLPKKRGAIRLLNLMPSRTDNSEVHCQLIAQNIEEGEQHKYEALSWCWGISTETTYINIRSSGTHYTKKVSPNLLAALKALRHPDKDRYLWIDAICIDQDHLDEKNHQVEMMYEIYGNAERVCIWLGEANQSSHRAIQFIKEDVLKLQDFDTLCDSEHTTKNWRSLLELMQRPWFSRRWVVQEIALARTAVIYCGKDRISWRKFAIAVQLFVEVETATHRLSEVMKKDRQDDYIPGWFEYVSALGASLLVDATERLFRDYKDEHRPNNIPNEPPASAVGTGPDSDSDDSCIASDENAFSPEQSNSLGAWRDPKVPKSRLRPLLSLEYLVSSLTIFQTTVPHDTIYALLAIAKDTTPSAATLDYSQVSLHVGAGLEVFTQRRKYTVDYKLPYVDVCRDFIELCVLRSRQNDGSRALDVICRPWATEERFLKKQRENMTTTDRKRLTLENVERRHAKKRIETERQAPTENMMKLNRSRCQYWANEGNARKGSLFTGNEGVGIVEGLPRYHLENEDMPLPSWVPQLSRAPYGMHNHPGIIGLKMSRKYADPLVGLPSPTHRNYAAAETKGIDMKAFRFRKRPAHNHFSMYVRGFCLGVVRKVEHAARNGQIPKEWAELGGWPDAQGRPPDAFWRTLVADRGKDGKNPPGYYSRACEESFKKGGFESGAVDTTGLINYGRNSIVAQFCRRVQAVIWNRALILTKDRRLGLTSKSVQPGDQVCILYGCSVPVILRKNKEKTEQEVEDELDCELEFLQRKIAASFRHYAARKNEHLKRKNESMVVICQNWEITMGRWFCTNLFRDYEVVHIIASWLCQHGLYKKQGVVDSRLTLKMLQEHLKELLLRVLNEYKKWYSIHRTARSIDEWQRLGRKAIYRPPTITDKWATARVSSAWHALNLKSPTIDWWEFERQLSYGRRWRRIVRERKASMQLEWANSKREQYREKQRIYKAKKALSGALEMAVKEVMKRQRVIRLCRKWREMVAMKKLKRQRVVRLCRKWRTMARQNREALQYGYPHDIWAWDRHLLSPNVQEHTLFSKDRDERSSNGSTDDSSHIGVGTMNYGTLLLGECVQGAPPGGTSHGQEGTVPGPNLGHQAETSACNDDNGGLNPTSNGFPLYSLPGPTSNSIAEDPCAENISLGLGWPRTRLSPKEARDYDLQIRANLRKRLGKEAYYSYQMLGECYIHGMMDGEAMRYQNEEAIASQVFELR